MRSLFTFTIGAVAGYCVCRYRKELVGLAKRACQKTKSPEEDLTPALESTFKPEYDIEAAKAEFLKKADKFTGIYESLYAVAHHKASNSDEVLNDWNTRVQHLDQADNFQRLWLEYNDSLEKVVDFFKACGIERDNRKTLIADQQTRYMYFTDADLPEIGATYEIIFPCWRMGNTILEKGTIKNIKNHD